MLKNVLNTDLTNKVAVVTGAGGVLCSCFAKVLARAGAKVALLDLNYESADQFAEEIIAEGGIAKAGWVIGIVGLVLNILVIIFWIVIIVAGIYEV